MQDNTPSSIAEHVQKSFRAATLRASVPYLLFALLLVVLVVLIGHEIERHISAMEQWIEGLGAWGLIAFAVIFVLTTTLLLPDSILCVSAGALFGLGWGTGVVLVGALLANALQFGLAQKLLRAPIQQLLNRKATLAALQRAVIQDELRLQVLLRLTPINPTIVSYMLGAAGVRFLGFAVASVALAPTLFVEVYLGHAGKHMVRMAGGGGKTALLQDGMLIAGLGVCIVVLFLVSKIARKALLDAVETSENRADGH